MARKRQLVLIKLKDPEDRLSETVPLGSIDSFAESVAPFNTAPDGSASEGVTRSFYGPGVIIEVSSVSPEVRQALVYCYNEDMAFPVLYRMCRARGWKLQDMESGQMFG